MGFKGNRHQYLRKLFLFLLIPTIVLTILLAVMIFYYQRLLRTEVISNYLKELSFATNACDEALAEVVQTADMLRINAEFKDIVFSRPTANPVDYLKISRTIQALQSFSYTSSAIDSVFILPDVYDIIISNMGSSERDFFFSHTYRYDKYRESDFYTVDFGTQYYKLLSQDLALSSISAMPRQILPLVMSAQGRGGSGTRLVINIRAEYLQTLLRQHLFSNDCKILVFDSSRQVSVASESVALDPLPDARFIEEALDSPGTPVYARIGSGEFVLLSSSSPYSSFNNQYMLAFFPVKDLSINLALYNSVYFWIGFAIWITLLGFSVVLGFRLYRPIQSLTKAIALSSQTRGDDHGAQGDELSYIGHAITSMASDLKSLENRLANTLPFACERQLINLLQRNDAEEENVLKMLSEHGIVFSLPLFQVVLVRMQVTEQFLATYTKNEQQSIQNSIMKMLNSLIGDELSMNVLTLDEHRIGIILNLDTIDQRDSIHTHFDNFIRLFDLDLNLVVVTIGLGQIRPGIAGLRQSYLEAASAAMFPTVFGQHSISAYREKGKTKNVYSLMNENKLINYLVNGMEQEAISLLESVVNQQSSQDSKDQFEFWSTLYRTLYRVMIMKGMAPENDLQDPSAGDPFLFSDDNIEMYGRFKEILHKICQLTDKNSTHRVDVAAIKQRIDEHYTEDLYLDTIADQYHVTTQYISKLFRDTAGIPFYHYLTMKRINHAKNLLKTTGLSIDNVAAKSGFNSRQTFIRMFRKNEGITPTQYRAQAE